MKYENTVMFFFIIVIVGLMLIVMIDETDLHNQKETMITLNNQRIILSNNLMHCESRLNFLESNKTIPLGITTTRINNLYEVDLNE